MRTLFSGVGLAMETAVHAVEDIASITNTRRPLDVFALRWQVTSLCNYSCAFCIQGTHEAHLAAARDESRELRQTICDDIVSMIETKLSGFSAIDLYLIGGEVSILDDFPAILRKLAGCSFSGLIRMHVTTNLSMPASTYAELFRAATDSPNGFPRSFSLSASFYRAYTTEDELCAKIKEIALAAGRGWSPAGIALRGVASRLAPGRQNAGFTINIGYPILDDQSYGRFSKLRRRMAIRLVSVKPIKIYDYPITLSDRIRNTAFGGGRKGLDVWFSDGSRASYVDIQQLGYALCPEHGRICPQGMVCDSGMRSVTIDTKGMMWRCPIIGAPDSFRMGPVTDPGTELLEAPAACSAKHCACNYFHTIERRGA